MKSARIFLMLALSAASLGACASPSSDDDLGSADDEILRFPSAVFASATPIAYGQTLPSIAFKGSDQFRAVRFMAAKGDRIRGEVSAGPGKSIVYLARKQAGGTYANVRAGGQDGTLPNVVVFGIDDADEYFLVFRTVPRADATFSVTLQNLAVAAGACADAGKLPSLAALEGAVQSGRAPTFTSPYLEAKIERRECLYATGCGAVAATYAAPLPSLVYSAAYDGANWSSVAKIVPSTTQPGITLDAAGNMVGDVALESPAGMKLPIHGSLGPTCKSLKESVLKVPVSSAAYTEYRVVGVPVTTQAQPSIPHPTMPKLATVPVIAPVADEVILARFPRGEQWLNFATAQALWAERVPAGTVRFCHPLTSCSPATPAGYLDDGCRFLLAGNGVDFMVYGAKVTGPSSYALNTSRGLIAIDDGVGTLDRRTVRVSENHVQFENAAYTDPRAGGEVFESSNATCTFPITWPPAP